MKKTKATQVIRYAPPHVGGMEKVISQVFDSLPDEEFEKEILCCSNTEKSSYDNGVKYTRCPFLFEIASNTISPMFLWKLSRVDTDILHYHMPFIFAVICHFIARPKYKKLYVSYICDIVGYDKIMKPFWWLYKKFLAKADKIHIMAPQVLESTQTIKYFKEKCNIIPYGISTEINLCPDSEIQDLRAKYKGKKIIFSLGRLVKYKGFKYAIEAMKYLDDNAILLLGGAGPLKDELAEYVKNNNLEEKVVLLGRVDDKDLDLYYQACDIYLLSSCMQSEVFGIVQLEAMKYSKPVVNTDLNTGVNFVSIHNETGLTVEPENAKQIAEAISLLLNNDELRLKFGQNARKRVEEYFDAEKLAEKYMEFYK